MIALSQIHARCLQILDEMPRGLCAFRPQSDPRGPTPTEEELLEALHQLDLAERPRIDALLRTLVLDWRRCEEDPQTWFLVEQRVRAAVFFLENTLRTLAPEDAYLPKDSTDEALEWALVKLWPFAGPLWCRRAARLLAAGIDLSQKPPPG